jgi:hypothetical protein
MQNVKIDTDARAWAQELFGGCQLNDQRLTKRLVDYAARQACRPEAGTSAACGQERAAVQGAQRLLKNERISSGDIEEGVFMSVVEQCHGVRLLLAIGDSTTVAVKYGPLAQEMAEWGCPKGFIVHSTMMVDADTGMPLGLVDQQRWRRARKRPGKKARHQRPYRSKESYKWESALRRVVERVPFMDKVISVTDRESDIYEYLWYLTQRGLRCVVRASSDRRLDKEVQTLWDVVAQAPKLGERTVQIQQRGALESGPLRQRRPARQQRQATVEVRACPVTLKTPHSRRSDVRSPVTLNAIYVREREAPAGVEPLEWLLLTSEPVDTFEQCATVIHWYEKRWLIEDFHAAWKVGCRIEERALQDYDRLERLYAITAPIAVRLLQLRHLQHAQPDSPCDQVLSKDEWQCLHASARPDAPLPARAPPMAWAVKAIARLAGWTDSKHTGRIGWVTMWKGWFLLQERVAGWRFARMKM